MGYMGPYDLEMPVDFNSFKACDHPYITTMKLYGKGYKGVCTKCQATWVGNSISEVLYPKAQKMPVKEALELRHLVPVKIPVAATQEPVGRKFKDPL
jgi:hypothetical protein